MHDAASPQFRPSLVPLVGLSVCAVAAGLGLATVVAMNSGWGEPGTEVVSAMWGSIAVALGAISGIVALSLVLSMKRAPLAVAVVGAGIARMLTSLAWGLALYFLMKPEGMTFWTAFLAGNLLALAGETVWGIKINNRDAAHASVTGSV